MKRAVFALMALFVCLIVLTSFRACLPRTESPTVARWVNIGEVEQLPPDGSPRRQYIYATESISAPSDASIPLGVIFVRRLLSSGHVSALHAFHCHESLAMRVEYDESLKCYRSCCWAVHFDIEGREIADAEGRLIGDRMPRLPVRVEGNKVLVQWKGPPCECDTGAR
jgi:hypothetical protein